MNPGSLFKRVVLASDHAGVACKASVVEYLEKNQEFFELDAIIDCGSFNASIRVDYPHYAKMVTQSIQSAHVCGILVCARGIGMSIAANRFKHIRAGLCYDIRSTFFARLHSNANVLVLAAESGCATQTVHEMLKTFLTTQFGQSRYQDRLAMIDHYEQIV